MKYLMFSNESQAAQRDLLIAQDRNLGPITTGWFRILTHADGRAAFSVDDSGLPGGLRDDSLLLSTGERGALSDTLWEQIELPNPCYISPSGSRSGDGTIGDPTLMEVAFTALSSSVSGTEFIVTPGDYLGDYDYYHSGTVANRNKIIFQHGARIKGHLVVWGEYTDFYDVSLYDEITPRNTPNEYGKRAYNQGLTINAPNNSVYGIMIRDNVSCGLSIWNQAANTIISDAYIYNVDGHGVYTNGDAGTKTFMYGSFGQNYQGGVRCYASNNDIGNYTFQHCTQFGDRWLVGGHSACPVTNLLMQYCNLYMCGLELGFIVGAPNDNITIDNCIILDESIPFTIRTCNNVTLQNNIIILASDGIGLMTWFSVHDQVAIIDNNTYYHQCDFEDLQINYFDPDLTRHELSISDWMALGYDQNSTFIQGVPDNMVKVDHSGYDNDKAIVTVFNFELLPSVSLDLSGGNLTLTNTYRLYNAANVDEYHEFVYDGNPVSLSMTGWTVAVPHGATEPLYGDYWPAFGCWLLRPA